MFLIDVKYLQKSETRCQMTVVVPVRHRSGKVYFGKIWDNCWGIPILETVIHIKGPTLQDSAAGCDE